MEIFELFWTYHPVLMILRTLYPLLGLCAPVGKCRYFFAGWQAVLKLQDLIPRRQPDIQERNRTNSSREGVIKLIPFTLRILDPDVMSFRHDPLVSIGIFYLAIKAQMLNRSRVVKWLTVTQQPILEFLTNMFNEYILIISEHKSTNFGSPVLFNLSSE
jgi:hypothetical protein